MSQEDTVVTVAENVVVEISDVGMQGPPGPGAVLSQEGKLYVAQFLPPIADDVKILITDDEPMDFSAFYPPYSADATFGQWDNTLEVDAEDSYVFVFNESGEYTINAFLIIDFGSPAHMNTRAALRMSFVGGAGVELAKFYGFGGGSSSTVAVYGSCYHCLTEEQFQWGDDFKALYFDGLWSAAAAETAVDMTMWISIFKLNRLV